jgi:hypothetical protein
MSETDKLNLFKGGLKPWVRAEIQWSRVLDLDSAISQAMSLVTQQSVLRENSKPSILSRGGIGFFLFRIRHHRRGSFGRFERSAASEHMQLVGWEKESIL